jgi:ribosome-binding protein aMBF1 (putative translation factor)
VALARDAKKVCIGQGRAAEEEGLTTRTSWTELKDKKLGSMTVAERAEYDRAYAEARLTAEVGKRVHAAREAAGLSQRELARRMGTSQAAIDRLESGGVGATLTTLQRVATALGLEFNVQLRPTA